MDERTRVIIADARERILDYRAQAWKATADRSLFHFAQNRKLTDPPLLSDCTCVDVYFSHRVSWGAPHPGLFEDFFPRLISPLLPKDGALVLTLSGLEPKYFDKDRFIDLELTPRKLDFFWLGPSRSRVPPVEFRSLFFEWPQPELKAIVELGFKGFLVQFEGYILANRNFQPLKELFEWSNDDRMFRELLRRVLFAFRVWTDNNGLFLATDRVAIERLADRLEVDKLERDVEAVIESYES